MKRAAAIVLVVLAGNLAILSAAYPTHPIKSRIARIEITRMAPPDQKKTIAVSRTADIASIQQSLQTIWVPIVETGSYEGSPKYDMTLTYRDGSAESIRFTRKEFISGGRSPAVLLQVVDSYLGPP